MSASRIKPPAVSARLRAVASRVPHPFWALAVLAAFAAAAPFIADDYGVHWDEPIQHDIARFNLRYIAGGADALPDHSDRYYGAAFELPALLAARALRLDDLRGKYLLRRLMTHLLFLGGAFACYALVYRMFGSVPLALIAMLLFLLHPRLYAHSFFNSKDSPFLAAFMIALYLAHRAFGKGAIGAFALLGVGVGLAANLRIIGIMLIPAVLGLRLCDLFTAPGWDGQDGRGRVLTTGAAFFAAGAAALYASSPYLWAAPLSLADAFKTFFDHPNIANQFYRGEAVRSDALPWHYIPTWIWITTPPLTLLLGIVGIAAAVRRGAANLAAIFRNTPLRFEFLLVACFALPIIAVAIFRPNMYDGWRQVHFLAAPLCVLAVLGLREALVATESRALSRIPSFFGLRFSRRGDTQPQPQPQPQIQRRITPALCARLGIYALVCAALSATFIGMLRLHPHEHMHFNFFVDRETPERLRKQYTMDYWGVVNIHAFNHLLERHPSGPIFVSYIWPPAVPMLPPSERYRIIQDTDADDSNNYHVVWQWYAIDAPPYDEMRKIHSVKVYNSAAAAVYGDAARHEAKAAAYTARHREIYAALTASEPAARSRYNIYLPRGENAIAYAKEPCAVDDAVDRFFLHVYPANPDDLPDDRKAHGFDNLDFHMFNPNSYLSPKDADIERASMLGGSCFVKADLPDYPIAELRTGQFNESSGVKIWTATLDLALDAAAAEREREAGAPK